VSEERKARLVYSLDEISREVWDACANPPGVPYNPFLAYDFLMSLEESRSACAETGWAPCHLVLEDEEEKVLGVVPMYLKSHSSGEYVFDQSWAHALERAGANYYPKLQVCVPFTPATGRRVLARNCPDVSEVERQLLFASIQAAKQIDVSSLHMTFVEESQALRLQDQGMLVRNDQQFHWDNDGYRTFDDFLTSLNSRKRKNLKKERLQAIENDIEIEWITGADLTEDHWDAFYQFYIDTGSRKWGQPYLTRRFFTLINERMAAHTLLIMCKREGQYIAGALNFIGGDTLFGRHWGCVEDHRFLHFEACYYQAIDFAIAHGLQHVEAGAQGNHKLARGYTPRKTYSLHYLADPGFHAAVEDYLNSERKHVEMDIEYLAAHSPFRKLGPLPDPSEDT
jgi:uncharacterized protein